MKEELIIYSDDLTLQTMGRFIYWMDKEPTVN